MWLTIFKTFYHTKNYFVLLNSNNFLLCGCYAAWTVCTCTSYIDLVNVHVFRHYLYTLSVYVWICNCLRNIWKINFKKNERGGRQKKNYNNRHDHHLRVITILYTNFCLLFRRSCLSFYNFLVRVCVINEDITGLKFLLASTSKQPSCILN